jgi:hypothetical protein
VARDGDRPRGVRRVGARSAAYRFSSAFANLFALFSLVPATPRRARRPASGMEENVLAPPGRTLHKTILVLTYVFVSLSLAASSALVVYTAWNHDLKNGALALAFAVLSARVSMNWPLWKNEE